MLVVLSLLALVPPFFMLHVQNIIENSAIAGILLVILLFGAGVFFLANLIIVFVYSIKWLYGALSALRKLNVYSGPILPIMLLCIIPFIGQIAFYLIYRKMIHCQQKYLNESGATYTAVSMNAINISLVLSILNVLVDASSSYLNISPFVSLIGALVAALALIQAITLYVRQQETLCNLVQQQFVDEKVNNAIWEREILKASEQVQATYASKDKE